MLRVLSVSACVLTLGISVISCSKKEEGTKKADVKVDKYAGAPIKIGVGGHFSRLEIVNLARIYPATTDGAMIKRGAELYIDKLNDQGGINGQKVGLVYSDDIGGKAVGGAGPEKVIEAAKKLAENQSISIVVGHFLNSTVEISRPIYEEHKLVQISPGTIKPEVKQGHSQIFLAGYQDSAEGVTLARYAREVTGAKKIAVLHSDDDASMRIKEALIAEAKHLELEVSAEVYEFAEVDFTPQLTKIKEASPDAMIIIGLYFDGATIALEARKMGMTIPFLGNDGLLSDMLIEKAGNVVEGMAIVNRMKGELIQDAHLSGPLAETFVKEFKEKYKTLPNSIAALTYDAVGIAVEAIKKVGTDRGALKGELAQWTTPEKGYKGVTGITYFGSDGDGKKILPVVIVQGGKFTYVGKQAF
ncbi:MAG: ABC transporter substrate-binding protein [Candidatus Tectomicrobia bacterium]|nr:ABC transporter substrate-binding protein [Candidatus Tectomicrobia bacterium]